MRVLVAPNEFKGCLSAEAVAACCEEGIRRADAAAVVVLRPLADGGAGTSRILAGAAPSFAVQVEDIAGRYKPASWRLHSGIAFIDVADAGGYLAPELRPPGFTGERASSYGTGQLVAAALGHPAVREVWLALGGSGASDVGVGFLEALGARFYANGTWIRRPRGEDLADVTAADLPLVGKPLIGLVDVAAPLAGPHGAARLFGPQKGVADPRGWDNVVSRVARVLHQASNRRITGPGSGAAGGLGAALLAVGGRLCSGTQAVLRHLDVDTDLDQVDWCLTGEGRVDAQTLQGKSVAGLARLAEAHGVPVVALTGENVVSGGTGYPPGLTGIYPVTPGPRPQSEAMLHAATYIADAAFHVTYWMSHMSVQGKGR